MASTAPPTADAAGPAPTASTPTAHAALTSFLPPIGLWRQHGHLLPPQRGLAGELPSLLLSGGVSVEGEDQLTDFTPPVPAPALHAKDRHHARHACREQRQRI